jgi:hypothetical protein
MKLVFILIIIFPRVKEEVEIKEIVVYSGVVNIVVSPYAVPTLFVAKAL